MIKYTHITCRASWNKIIRPRINLDRIWVLLWFCVLMTRLRGGLGLRPWVVEGRVMALLSSPNVW